MSKIRPIKPWYIIEKQQASFSAFAKKSGYSSKTLGEMIFLNLTATNASHRKILNRAYDKLEGSDFLRGKNAFENCKTHWDCFEIIERSTSWYNLLVFTKHVPEQIINWKYLYSVSKKHSLSKLNEKTPSLKDLLMKFPVAFMFEYEFDAYVEHEVNEMNPPGLFFNYLLLHSITELTHLAAWHWTIKMSPESIHSDSKIPSESDLNNEAARLISFLLGKVLFSQRYISNELEPELFLVAMTTEINALSFITFHEYSHLVLGHLNLPRNKNQEYEADWLSILTLTKTRTPYKEFSIVMVFALINIIECVFSQKMDTHPSSTNRMIVIAHESANAGLLCKEKFHIAVDLLRDLFNPSLENEFGIRLFQELEA